MPSLGSTPKSKRKQKNATSQGVIIGSISVILSHPLCRHVYTANDSNFPPSYPPLPSQQLSLMPSPHRFRTEILRKYQSFGVSVLNLSFWLPFMLLVGCQ
jgi:hypothetical protein